jgi:hypothetical protein
MSFITPKEGWGIVQSVPLPSMPPQSVQNVPSFCGNCGKQVSPGPKFCTWCGVPTEDVSLSRPPQQHIPAFVADYPKTYHQPYQQPYAPAHVFQPQITQQVTVVQAQRSPSGFSGWWLFWLLFFPFWPISIPIMIIALIFGLWRSD